jgi:thiol-disulfide isomerase/thioredoxin
MSLRLRTEMPELQGITEWVHREVTRAQLQAQPVLIYFWSISCGICKESLPAINQMREEYPELQIIGIHMPRSEEDTDVAAMKEAIVKYQLQHPQGIDNEHRVVDRFANEYVPAFYLFDKNGLLRHRSVGEKALSMLRKPIERVLTETE